MEHHRQWITLDGVIERGHQVASGQAPEGPYPAGTIQMQKPFFKALGMDLEGFYEATLNVSIHPYRFSVEHPEYTFPMVEWTSLHPPETFSFSRCQIVFDGTRPEGWLYYPHPETKQAHFQNPSIVELILPYIPNLHYGDRIQVVLDANEIVVKQI